MCKAVEGRVRGKKERYSSGKDGSFLDPGAVSPVGSNRGQNSWATQEGDEGELRVNRNGWDEGASVHTYVIGAIHRHLSRSR